MQDESSAYIPLRAKDGSIRAYAIVDIADYEWASQYNWHLSRGYARRSIHVGGYGSIYRGGWQKTENRLLHRELLGVKPNQWVDHINRSRLDNRRVNLRLIDARGNVLNSGMSSNNSSGYRGVHYVPSYRGKKWRVQLTHYGQCMYIAVASTPEDAARFYDEAALRYHGEYAQLNFPNQANETKRIVDRLRRENVNAMSRPRSLLEPWQRRAMVRAHEEVGLNYSQLGRSFGVAKSTARYICKTEGWRTS